MMSSRSMLTAALVVVGLLLTGCSAPADTVARERGSAEYDPFRSARTEEFVSTADGLTTVKSAPARLVIDALGLAMPVDVEGLAPNGEMSLPVSPFRAGWYEYAAAPNSSAGATVIAAHVDSLAEGVGPFARLRGVQAGTEVSVVDVAGITHTYVVTAVERIAKGEVPWGAYFSLAGEPRLVLITCGGDYDYEYGNGRGRYEDNYIVTAERVS